MANIFHVLQKKTGAGSAPFYNSVTQLNTLYGTDVDERYGGSMFSDGEVVFIGRPGSTAQSTSSARSYTFDGTAIGFYQNPNDSGTNTGDRFGQGIGFTSKWKVIGAPLEDETNPFTRTNSGIAYVYLNDSSNYERVIRNPNASGTSDNDQFGSTIAVSGDYAAIGSYRELGGVGVVYIYDLNTATRVKTIWNPNASGDTALDQFGQYTIAMANNYLVVGSWLENAGNTKAGALYVFKTDNGLWNDAYLLHTITDPTPVQNGAFGIGHSFDGRYLFAGAPAGQGNVHLYDLYGANPTVPSYTFNNPGVGSSYGRSISHKGTTLVIGAGNNNNNSGQVFVYSLDPMKFGQLMLTIDNPNINNVNIDDRFGSVVKTNGTHLCVSAAYEDYEFLPGQHALDAGVIYWFELNE